ncbi:EAL domain-containing protein [Sedimenticola hydrogenitrophicus]|uniref:EAL domain-containing protein n=1 Tax=Sedimenticola hydrogenitrophicus TaxID=2967975 RepID=UPI0021A5FBA4
MPERIWAANFYREVVDLAASSGSLVVAEGIERQTQSDFVRWAGVDIIQGFLYSRPQPLLAESNGGMPRRSTTSAHAMADPGPGEYPIISTDTNSIFSQSKHRDGRHLADLTNDA